MKTERLTPKQQMVIELLQNGEKLITAAANPPYEKAFAGVTCGQNCIQLSLRVFWNLYEKQLIYQEGRRHTFVLTTKGRDLKFKKEVSI